MPRLERILPKPSTRLPILPIGAVLLGLCTVSAKMIRAEGSNAVEPHTEAAVIADDKGWDKAEESGDTAFIDAFLCRSIARSVPMAARMTRPLFLPVHGRTLNRTKEQSLPRSGAPPIRT